MIHSKRHSNILKITLVITNVKSKSFDANFAFRDNSSSEVIKLIKTLNVKKASQKSDIPTKIVKLNAGFFGNFICKKGWVSICS